MADQRKFLGLTAKFPEPGKVKTRLSKDIGPDNAAEVYRRIAEKVFEKTCPIGPDYRRIVFFAPLDMQERFKTWIPGERLMPQRGEDIGWIMANALKDMFDSGAEKAVIAGVDVPALDRELVEKAFRQLDGADIVIGPALDGGYYLIGMKSLHREIFRDISWSTDRVFEETLSIIKKLKLIYQAVEILSDIDRLEDLIDPNNADIVQELIFL